MMSYLVRSTLAFVIIGTRKASLISQAQTQIGQIIAESSKRMATFLQMLKEMDGLKFFRKRKI